MTLQRSIGNQATTRIILRELLSRKNQRLVQRLATDNSLLDENGQQNSSKSKGFWSDKQALDFSTVTLDDFKTKKNLQTTNFDLAQKQSITRKV